METRREWLTTMRTGLMTAVVSPLADPRSSDEGPRAGQGGGRTAGAPERLSLDDFQPKSALHVPEHRVERPRFPVIDFHTHLTWSGKTADGRADAEADHRHRTGLRCSGGHGSQVGDAHGQSHGWARRRADGNHRPLRRLARGPLHDLHRAWWSRASDPDYPSFQAAEIERAHRAGARGVKVLKTLGLYLRDRTARWWPSTTRASIRCGRPAPR